MRGGYVVWEPEGARVDTLAGIFLATGSEVELAIRAAEQLHAKGQAIRVVSLPCWEAFAEQSAEYRESVLPKTIGRERRLAIEAGCSLGWERYADHVLGIDHFGASAPAEVLAEKFGFTPANIATVAREVAVKCGARQ